MPYQVHELIKIEKNNLMSKELIKTDAKEIVAASAVTDKELIQHLENMGLLKELSAGQKNTYLQICKAFNLNPFKREVHVSMYNGQMSIITGYETYIKRAERSGVLDGWEVTTDGSVKDDSLKAIITISRKDRSKPFVWEVKYSEYVQRTKDGTPNKFWREKPEHMTKKVAMAQGFRLCFSDELGGMPYTSEETETQNADFEIMPTMDELKDAIEKLEHCHTVDELKLFKETLSDGILKSKTFIDAAIKRYHEVNEPVNS